jgi:hypothetical protein
MDASVLMITVVTYGSMSFLDVLLNLPLNYGIDCSFIYNETTVIHELVKRHEFSTAERALRSLTQHPDAETRINRVLSQLSLRTTHRIPLLHDCIGRGNNSNCDHIAKFIEFLCSPLCTFDDGSGYGVQALFATHYEFEFSYGLSGNKTHQLSAIQYAGHHLMWHRRTTDILNTLENAQKRILKYQKVFPTLVTEAFVLQEERTFPSPLIQIILLYSLTPVQQMDLD